jgi:hypothetical protein
LLFNLSGLACPAVGSCIATAQYEKRGGTPVPLIETLSGGSWTPETAQLPKAGKSGVLVGMSCLAPGNCLAVGSYETRGGQLRYLAETLSGRTWTPAALPLPAGAQATQPANLAGLSSVACRAAGSCVAAGFYAASGGVIQFAIDTLSGGTWTAIKAPLPTEVQDSGLNRPSIGVACSSADSCVAVGGYVMHNGTDGQAVIDTASPGTSKPRTSETTAGS